MKTKRILSILSIVFIPVLMEAQSPMSRHLYLHAGITAGNVYTSALSTLATWGLNELTHSNIFESGYEWQAYSGKAGDEDMTIHNFNALGYKANELFGILHPSIKVGWQSSSFQSSFNGGVYLDAEYQQSLFKTRFKGGTFEKNALGRMLFGGSVFAVLGSIEKPYRIMIEAGCRYSIATGYKGPLAAGKEDIANGLTSHYGIKVGGARAIQDFGLFVDINHFDLLKGKGNELNRWAVGLSWSITPGQREHRSNILK